MPVSSSGDGSNLATPDPTGLEELLIERRIRLQLGVDLLTQPVARFHAPIVQRSHPGRIAVADERAEESKSLRAVQPFRRSGEGTRQHGVTKAGTVVIEHVPVDGEPEGVWVLLVGAQERCPVSVDLLQLAQQVAADVGE